MSNELLFTLVCDDVRIEQSQKILIVGLYNKIINFRPVPTGPPTLILPQLCMFRRWRVESPGTIVKTVLIDPKLKRTLLRDVSLQLPADGSYFQDVLVFPGMVLQVGEYTIKSEWDSFQHETYFQVTIG